MPTVACVLAVAAAVLSAGGIAFEFGWGRWLSTSLLKSNDSLAEDGYRRLLEGDVKGGLERFELALGRDMASPYRWCDLAEACLAARQIERARYCMARAVEAGPNFPPILMRAVNFHLRLAEPDRALLQARRILELVPDYDEAIFDSCRRMGIGVDDVLAKGLPRNRRAAQAYFRHLMSGGGLDSLQKTWDWIVRQSLADDRLADEYVGQLVRAGRHELAAKTWAAHVAGREDGYPASNPVFNGSFERDFAGTVFDWRIENADGVQANRERGTARSGEWSLCLRFEGKENVAYGHVSQRAFLKPGVYRFEAEIRAFEATTDSGARFRIFDAEDARRLDISTEQVLGTTGWTQLSKEFTVSAPTRLAGVQVVRRLSEKFDNKIRGTFWIDDVRLTRVR